MIEGGCDCGGTRYRLGRPPMFVNCCHCRRCQRQTGSAFVVNAFIETDQIELLAGAPEPVTTTSGSGGPHDIYRCPTCRTALWSDYNRRPGLRVVRVATLDDPAAYPPGIHIFTTTKLPWVILPANIPSVPAYYDPAAVWPAASVQRREAALHRA